MSTRADNVLITADQIAEGFNLKLSRVRAWIAAGLIKPVRREGRGRSGQMLFYRGEVASVVYGVCATCGERYKRTTLKQYHCSRLCRDRARRAKG